jgi:hypothetical protein
LLELLPNNFECGKNDHAISGEFLTGSPNDPGNIKLHLVNYFVDRRAISFVTHLGKIIELSNHERE